MENEGQPLPQPVPKVHAAIVAVMEEIGAIEKTRRNEQQNFMFRGVGDAMAACQPLFVKHKLYVRPLKVSSDSTKQNLNKEGKPHGIHSRQTIVYRVTSAEDGSFIDSEATGEAIDFGDKCAGKVMSVSFKFFIFQLFCIPDHNPENDPDNQSPQAGGREQPKGRKEPPPPAAKQGAKDEKTKALESLVALLKQKGVTGKQVLKWTSEKLQREIKRLGEITKDEFTALKSSAESIKANESNDGK